MPRLSLYLWLPVFLWIVIVLYLSSLPHIFITDIPYLVPAVKLMFGVDLHELGREAVRHSNFLFRKGLHVLVYLVLGFLLLRAMTGSGVRTPLWKVVLILVAVAAVDEYHQSFNPQRTGQFTDVMIDLSGGLLGCGLYLTYLKLTQLLHRVLRGRGY